MWSRIRYGFRDYAPQLFGLILCADVFLILSLGQDSEPGIAHAPAPGPPPVSAQRGHLFHTNLLGGYAFTYPRTWTVKEEGVDTELASPDGETVLSFSSGETLHIGHGGGEHPGDQDLLRIPRLDRRAIGARHRVGAGRRAEVLPGEWHGG